MTDTSKNASMTKQPFYRRTTLSNQLFAEFLGTFIIIAIGDGVCIQAAVGTLDNALVPIAWGFAVMLATYVSGSVSGAHFNPAVTLALGWRQELAASKVVPYCVAQLTGAVCGAALVMLDYKELLASHVTVMVNSGRCKDYATAWSEMHGVLYTHPRIDAGTAFIDHVVATAFLLMAIRAVTDSKNAAPPVVLRPVIICAVIIAVSCAFGSMAGCPLNPARDLGPRIFATIGTWGFNPFQEESFYWWIPIVAPVLGAFLGVAAYDFGVARALRSEHAHITEEQRSREGYSTSSESIDFCPEPNLESRVIVATKYSTLDGAQSTLGHEK